MLKVKMILIELSIVQWNRQKEACRRDDWGRQRMMVLNRMWLIYWLIDWLNCGFMSHSTQNRSFQRRFRFPYQAKTLAWYGKRNLAQQKHTFTDQQKCTATQNKHKKTKARFTCLLRHPAWKRRGPILILALHKFVTFLLTSTLTHLQTYMGLKRMWKA